MTIIFENKIMNRLLNLVFLLSSLVISANCNLNNNTTSSVIATTVKTTSEIISVDELVDQIIKNQSNITVITNHNVKNSTIEDDRDGNPDLINVLSFLPPDFMNAQFRRNGGYIVHILVFCYLCFVLTLVIDSYFVPSLQMFNIIYGLSLNIIGSTLMVFGTSLPELFASIISAFIGGKSIGTATIVVSSLFNLLAIPGICGLIVLTPRTFSFICINAWPVRREIIFYSITIVIFILSIKDDSIDCIESLIFIFIYTVYMLCLYLWSHFEIIQQQQNRRKFFHSKDRPWLKYTHYLQQSKINMKPAMKKFTISNPRQPSTSADQENISESSSKIYRGTFPRDKFLKSALIPFRWLFSITIPPANRRSFIATYILSSVWIVAITYFLMWMISIISKAIHFTHSSSVLNMLALGNITKMISSIIVIKRLNSVDMAICHVIGSNIFNILICLGLPWFLKILILTVKEGTTLEKLQAFTIDVDYRLFEYVAISLTILLLIFILIFYLSNWKLSIRSSYSFTILYIFFLVCLLIFDQYISIV
ncbi:sodium/potassium/calcium exchanger 5-like [Dermatophagoides pteronyssinus]|uniref:sodium/potassium/calcium exchanger 5-like n=1 Tax=Dermatophagoides pteronyssinus TaxID=6956 RepID=UPI003F67CEF1